MKNLFKTELAVLTIISLIAVSCSNKPAPPPPNPIKEYAVITAERRAATLNLDYPATLEGSQTVEIRPRVEGIIQQIYVDDGARVKRGQPLFRLDQAKYLQNVRAFQANIQVAEANVTAAELEVDKIKPLVEKDIISKFTLQSAQLTLQSRQAALAQARAALANARTDLGYTVITSPTDGVIGTIPYKVGALVNSGIPEPLTTVADTRDVAVYFSVNEKQLTDLKIARSPQVFLILPDGAQHPQSGTIQTVSGLINTATGSARLRASFPNPLGALRSGGTGTIRIPRIIDTALLVPQKATYEVQGKKFVYVVAETDSNKVKAVEISVNPITYKQSFVVTGGLKPGVKIVIEGVGALTAETKIKPKMVNADSLYNATPEL